MNYAGHQFILAAIEGLRTAGNWTGRTHVQKTLFLANATIAPEMPFEFVLYKHGPYSFDVDSELAQMESYGAVVVVPQRPYGPTLKTGDGAKFPRKLGGVTEASLLKVKAVARFVDERSVFALEALATAVWIRVKEDLNDTSTVTTRLRELKPHLSETDAATGVADSIIFLSKIGHTSHSKG